MAERYPDWVMGALADPATYPPDEWTRSPLRTGAPAKSIGDYFEEATQPRVPDRVIAPSTDPNASRAQIGGLGREVGGVLHDTFVQPVKDAFRTGQMTEQEQQDFAFNAFPGAVGPGFGKLAKAGFNALYGAVPYGSLGMGAGGRMIQPQPMGAMFAEPSPAMRALQAPGKILNTPLQTLEESASGALKGVRDILDQDARTASTVTAPRLASPEEINKAARATSKGATQPELREVYRDLGLTGQPPSELLRPSLAASQTQEARDQALALKLADREMLNTLTPEQRAFYKEKQKMPAGMMLPSKEAKRSEREAFAPIKAEVKRVEDLFDANALAGNRPSLFDLSADTLMKVPDVPQFSLPRVGPELTERLATVQRGGMGRVERAAANAPLENWGWYNLQQTRDLFHSLHGKERGEQAFNAWLDGVAGTSMLNPIDNNIRSSTWYLQQALLGNPMPEVLKIADPTTGKALQALAGGPPPGYGAKGQIQHAARVNQYMTGMYDPVKNPKPLSYRMNLGGNWDPRTVDTHDIRNMVGMPLALELFGENGPLLAKEYAYLERLGGRAAKRAGQPQASQQAATWVGGGIPSELFPAEGGYTHLKSFPAPLQEALNRRAHVTATVYGITPEQALRDAFTGKRPLLGIGGMLGGGGAAMGGLADQGNYGQQQQEF